MMANPASRSRDMFSFMEGRTNAQLAEPEYSGGYDPMSTRRRGIDQDAAGLQRQDQLGQAIQQRMAGNSPSVAEMQMRRGMLDNQAAIASQANSARGTGNRMRAQRDALGALAQANGATNEGAAQLRAQEQMAAEGRMGELAMNQRMMALQQQQMASGEQQQLMQAQADRDRAMFEQEKASQQASSDFWGGALKTGMTALSMSDVRAKEDVRPVDMSERIRRQLSGSGTSDQEVRRAMDSIEPVSYRYRPEYGGGPEEVGIRAQDMERSGSDVIQRGPDGMAYIDKDKATKFNLAATGDLNDRLSRIEEMLAGSGK